jgi:surface-anchored protein
LLRRLTCLSGLLVAGALSAASAQAAPVVLDSGDPVIDGRLVGGAWRLQLAAGMGTDAAAYDPADAILAVPRALATTLPDDAEAFGFLGAGSAAYLVQARGDELPLTIGVGRYGSIVPADVPGRKRDTWINRVDGPGRVAAFTYYSGSDPNTGEPELGTVTDVAVDSTRAQPGGWRATTTTTPAWAFTEPGRYCLDVTSAATLASGQRVSDRRAITVAVGVDPASVDVCPAPTGADVGLPPEPAVKVLNDGHLDVLPVLSDAGLELDVRHEGVVRSLDDVVLHAPDASRRLAPGAAFWQLPGGGAPTPGLLWAGFNLSEAPDDALARNLTWRIDGISGPGQVALFETDGPGEQPMFATRVGLPAALAAPSARYGHFHFAWTFSAPGVYCLDSSVTGRRANGEPLRAQGQITVVVGATDPHTVTPCGRTGTPAPVGVRAIPTAEPVSTPLVATSTSADAFDLRPRLDGDRLVVDLHDADPAGPGVLRRPQDVVFLGRSLLNVVDEDKPWRGLPGAVDYTVQPGPEWNLDGLDPAALDGDVTLRLVAHDGPGTVSLDDQTQSPVWDHAALLGDVPGHERATTTLWAGTRSASPVWNFSAPGRHCVTLEWSARLASGRAVSTTSTLTLVADPNPLAAPDPETGEWIEQPAAIDAGSVRPCGVDPAAAGSAPVTPVAEAPAPVATPTEPSRSAEPVPTEGRSALAVRLSVSRLARTGAGRVRCALPVAGTCTVRVTIAASRARRLGLRATAPVVIAQGRVRLAVGGTRWVTVRPTAQGRRALRRAHGSLPVVVRASATADGFAPGSAVVARRLGPRS